MLIVIAAITAAPGKRDAFIQAAQPCIAATRKEDGCLHYELLASTENADALLYYERWASREALEWHQVSEHMKTFRQLRKEQGLEGDPVKVDIFDVPA